MWQEWIYTEWLDVAMVLASTAGLSRDPTLRAPAASHSPRFRTPTHEERGGTL